MASWEGMYIRWSGAGRRRSEKRPGAKERERGWLGYSECARGNVGRDKGLGMQEGTARGT